MTKDEALKMAYKAEETGNLQDLVDAVNALIEALEQPAQEPVAWIDHMDGIKTVVWKERDYPAIGTKLYTHPAQPLSDDEIWDLVSEIDVAGEIESLLVDFGRMVEQAHGIGVKVD